MWHVPGGVFPDQEPGGRGPPLKKNPQNWSILGWFFRRGPLPPGSWSGNIVNRNPPRRGGFLSIKTRGWKRQNNMSKKKRWKQIFFFEKVKIAEFFFCCDFHANEHCSNRGVYWNPKHSIGEYRGVPHAMFGVSIHSPILCLGFQYTPLFVQVPWFTLYLCRDTRRMTHLYVTWQKGLLRGGDPFVMSHIDEWRCSRSRFNDSFIYGSSMRHVRSLHQWQ